MQNFRVNLKMVIIQRTDSIGVVFGKLKIQGQCVIFSMIWSCFGPFYIQIDLNYLDHILLACNLGSAKTVEIVAKENHVSYTSTIFSHANYSN